MRQYGLAPLSRHASAPPQLDPAPAVQPKQWPPVAMRRARNRAGGEVADVRAASRLDAQADRVVEVAVVAAGRPRPRAGGAGT